MDAPTYLTPEQLSERWLIPLGTLANWRSRKQGPTFFKAGPLVRYELTAVREFEDANTFAVATPGASARLRRVRLANDIAAMLKDCPVADLLTLRDRLAAARTEARHGHED